MTIFKPVRATGLTAENRLARLNLLPLLALAGGCVGSWQPTFVALGSGAQLRKTDLENDMLVDEHTQRSPGTTGRRDRERHHFPNSLH